ncbi:type II RES/Xre toxin-antitoxin system antitoxin [Larkinella soli]|uniref:type II RES/Xre toxin-antitoxin system antitoxin n=1 Tax=Larkinella soli TaxID=1770527 RepID=UPI000FFB68EF|nr:antitoxin Xre/MbcA/ParS toxin-binding domain-containing protein [Larkinella soli]
MATTGPHSSGASGPAHRRRPASRTGGEPVYQPEPLSPLTLIEKARQGVSTQKVDQLSQLLGVSLKEMANLLQLAERTLHRFRSEGRLDEPASERLLTLENLAVHGLLVFDGRADALADWLRYPLKELAGQTPLALLNTITGFRLVDDVLTRIEYGVYS